MRTVEAGDAEIAVEVLGPEDGPAMLLLGGLGWSMDWWDDDLVARLVERGHRVIRYDQRDTGDSTTWPAGAPGYTFRDLVTDAVAVLDAVGAPAANFVGLSMGGAVAQHLAIGWRDRVRALTLVATSTDDPAAGELPPSELPPSELTAPGPPTDDPVETIVAAERRFAGRGAFDEARVRVIAGRVVRRTRDLAAAANPMLAGNGGLERVELARIAGLPVLVIHGVLDPLFPIGHGRALAAAIPGARLLELEAMGHQLPPESTWGVVVDTLTALG